MFSFAGRFLIMLSDTVKKMWPLRIGLGLFFAIGIAGAIYLNTGNWMKKGILRPLDQAQALQQPPPERAAESIRHPPAPQPLALREHSSTGKKPRRVKPQGSALTVLRERQPL
mgnify:CR=1 FL=1|jgi:hypothetical protein